MFDSFSWRYYLRILLAAAVFVACVPGMVAAWSSVSNAVIGGCADNRTGQVWREDGMAAAGDYCRIRGKGEGVHTAYDDAVYYLRADGIVEPVVYFRWQGAPGVPGAIARTAQVGMAGGIALAAASMAYMLMPMGVANVSRQ